MPATATPDMPLDAEITSRLASEVFMDCIRCLDHHPVNEVCLAGVARWVTAHRHLGNLTYEFAYEHALLDDLLH